jgi:NADPH2:quinone reductase
MKAVLVTRFGPPGVLELQDVDEPAPGPDAAMVRVAVCDVLFLDTQIRRGVAQWFPARPPYSPGLGVAGQVEAIGSDVSQEWMGRRVVATTPLGGGYAERAIAPASSLVAVPDDVELPEAVALLHDGRTALGLLETTGIERGDRVLVTNAAGGLGILLVQLAIAAGATVVAAARGAQKLQTLADLGADGTVDYTTAGWPDRVRDAFDGSGPNVVFDGAGGTIGTEAYALTAPGGRFSAHGAPGGEGADVSDERGVTVRGIDDVQFEPAVATDLTRRAIAALAAGRLRPHLGQTFALADAGRAHEAIEARAAVGKTVLAVDR